MALRPFLSKGVPFSNVRPSWHSDFRGVNFGIQTYPVAYSGAIEAIEDHRFFPFEKHYGEARPIPAIDISLRGPETWGDPALVVHLVAKVNCFLLTPGIPAKLADLNRHKGVAAWTGRACQPTSFSPQTG